MRHKPQTSGFPRVNCLVDGCKRGTTRIPPLKSNEYWVDHEGREPRWICGTHWRQVPKAWKQRRSLFKRRRSAAEKRGDEEKEAVLLRTIWRNWNRIEQLFNDPDALTTAQGMPVAMNEELKKLALI